MFTRGKQMSTTESVRIRRASAADVPVLARFGRELAELHVSFDGRRFVGPEGGETAFAKFFGEELERSRSVVLIAENAEGPVGYAFVRWEDASLEDLRGAGAWLHDLYVESGARAGGVGRRLVQAAKEAARGLGSPSLMLGVSPHNGAARHLFERSGLRPTMVEMRVELDS